MGVMRQVLATGVVCYLTVSTGLMFAWPSSTYTLFKSNETTLHRPMGETELALFGSLSSIGALVSTPVAGYSMDFIGRKYAALMASLMYVISWTIIATSRRVEVVLTAVFVSGLGTAVFLIAPVYVSEITHESIRGTLTSGTVIFYAIGLLLSYLLASLPYHDMVYMGLGMASFGSLLLLVLRESPVYLMKKGRAVDAAKSIAFYRGQHYESKIVRDEMDALRRAFNPVMDGGSPEEQKLKPETQPKVKLSIIQFIRKSRSTRRAMLLSLVLITCATFQGLVVVQVYAQPLFKEAVPSMSPILCSILLAVVTFISGLVAAYLSDLAGRRPLMIYSSAATGVCSVLLGLQLQFHWGPHWLTAVLIYVYTITFSLGAGLIPLVVVAEVFLPEIKGFMSTFVFEWAWVCSFVILFIFNPLVEVVGLGPVFYLFAFICFISVLFCVYFQPETKGLPVDAIQHLFTQRRGKNNIVI